MKNRLFWILAPSLLSFLFSCSKDNTKQIEAFYSADIPLPEHPRPDWEREAFQNLNGEWMFKPDSSDAGEQENWFANAMDSVFTEKITVPFSWASPLSKIGKSNFDFAWYARDIMVPRDGVWKNKRCWVIIGASDYTTTLWVNGQNAGEHEGGFTPIEFDITNFLSGGPTDRLVIRTEDLGITDRPEGKQMLGQAKGIWQTVYLEGRSPEYIRYAHFSPDIDSSRVAVTLRLDKNAEEPLIFSVAFENNLADTFAEDIPVGSDSVSFTIPIPNEHLWSLDDPFLYNVNLGLDSEKEELDRVYSYFGMRKIGVGTLPDSPDPYITLNNQPVYLKLALDQSLNPAGFYSYPTDQALEEDVARAKQLGFNGIRINVQAPIPRKLFWADTYGLLVMQDIPNWWGNPDDDAKRNWKKGAEAQIMRDFNHPGIFSWVLFHENWGISTMNINGVRVYLPQNREWVKTMYQWAKELDPTRLIDDNSSSTGDHVATDINSWNSYQPVNLWGKYLDDVVSKTGYGGAWNFATGGKQDNQPLVNTLCGEVLAYRNGTGDIDITYGYHLMMNALRRHQKNAGFVYDGLYDTINQWSGFFRYDRTAKEFGLDDLCPGMTIADLNSDLYLIPGRDFEQVVQPDSTFLMPVTASFMSNVMPVRLTVKTTLHGWNRLGEHKEYATGEFEMIARPYAVYELPQVKVTAPPEDCLAVWTTTLLDPNGNVLSRNFVPFRVQSPGKGKLVTSMAPAQVNRADSTAQTESARRFRQLLTRIENPDPDTFILRQRPNDYAISQWSGPTGAVLDSMKVWAAGAGYYEYQFMMPEGITPDQIGAVIFSAELSSRQLQSKDVEPGPFPAFEPVSVDAIHRDPSSSPNSYPQTDTRKHSSQLTVSLNDGQSYTVVLDDDPADHRGLLSWINQPHYDLSWALFEPGTYGYLVNATFGEAVAQKAAAEGSFRIRLAVSDSTATSGGLSVYGEKFGRYPLGPTLVIKRK